MGWLWLGSPRPPENRRYPVNTILMHFDIRGHSICVFQTYCEKWALVLPTGTECAPGESWPRAEPSHGTCSAADSPTPVDLHQVSTAESGAPCHA